MRLCEPGTEKKTKVNSCIEREEGRIPFGSESDDWTFDGFTCVCGVCGVSLGSFHHPGCDVEECPKCHEQLLFCHCDLWEYRLPGGAAFGDVRAGGCRRR